MKRLNPPAPDSAAISAAPPSAADAMTAPPLSPTVEPSGAKPAVNYASGTAGATVVFARG